MQIEIQAIHPPGPGRKTGTVVDREGQRYECWPEKLDQLAVGHAYDVEISEREYDGRTIRKIAKVQKARTLFTAGTGVDAGPDNSALTRMHQNNGSRKTVDPLEVQFVTEMLKLITPLPAASIALAARDMRDVYRRTFVEG